jgi:hypothetical protein
MTTMDAPREALDMGRVIRETFAVLSRNLPTFVVLALILTTLPAAIAAWLQQEALGPSDSTTATVTKVLAGLVPIVTGAVLQGAVTYGAILDLNGRRSTIAESLAVGLRAFLPLIAIGILLTIAMVIGLILLVVPGLIMMVTWIVATPSYIAERRGIAEAFGRSAELTDGARWPIFGLLLIYWVLVICAGAALGGIAGGLMIVSDGDAGGLIRQVVLNPLLSGITGLIGCTGAAVIYVELRRLREGASPEQLAAVFD